jgi:hypothetical protein
MEETALSYPLGFDTLGVDSSWPSAAPITTAFSGPDLPQWLVKARAELAALRKYPRDWDSYGAPEIDQRVLAAASILLEGLVFRTTPRPSIVPTRRLGTDRVAHSWNGH